MIALLFRNLHFDGDTPITDWEILLRVVADFTIVIDGHKFYEESEFCVVEFAMQIREWVESLGKRETDFSYDSLESDERGLVRLERTDRGWTLIARDQLRMTDRLLSTEEVVHAVNAFTNSLRRETLDRFQIDISRFLLPELGSGHSSRDGEAQT